MAASITLEQLLYSYYIRYDTLQMLTQTAFAGSDANVVNVYIDMANMLRPIYAQHYGVAIENYTTVASSFINLCAHMRAYFRSRHHVETRIYLVYSDNLGDTPRRFYTDYAATWVNNFNSKPNVTKMIKDNLDLLRLLCPYFNDIFLLETTNEPTVAIFDRINKDELLFPGVPNIVLTKDIYAYQLPAMKTNTVIYRPCKHNGVDESFVVSTGNVLPLYMEATHRQGGATLDLAANVNPQLLSLFMAMTNVPSRDLKSVYNANKAIAVINNLIMNQHIVDGYNFVQSLVMIEQKIQPTLRSRPGPQFNVLARYKAIDMVFQHSLYMNTPECMNEAYLIRKIDDDSVREINDKYFAQNPLDLNRL